jgi:hypothetical protein
MANVSFNPIITDINGSVGNITFQKSRYSSILRKKPFSNKFPSVSQQSARNYVALIKTAWNNLSTHNRNLWEHYSSVCRSLQSSGSGRILSAYNLFFSHNLILLHAGGSILESLKLYANESQFSQPVFYGSLMDMHFTLPDWFDSDQYIIYVKATPPLSPTIKNPLNYFRVLVPDISEPNDVSILFSYISVFGRQPVAGELIYYQFCFIHKYSPYVQPYFTDSYLFT